MSGKMNGTADKKAQQMNGKQNITEGGPTVSLNDPPHHRPLTPLRRIRGIVCLFIILSTAFFMLVYCAPVTALFLRLLSIRYSRKATSFLFGTWLSLWPCLFEKINKTNVIFSGQTVPDKERVLLFANHRTEVDWMYLWNLALRKGRLGQLKYILKSSLMKLPVFGWAFHVMEFIPVERKWEIDEEIMRNRLEKFKDRNDPMWLALFPEGTDYTEQKCIKSQKFAAENGLPILRNVLLPKARGFTFCVEELRSSLDAVYDVTIAYKHRLPVFLDNIFGTDPAEVHVHIERIKLDEIPSTEAESADWLIERFRLKDELLANFMSTGHFPNEGTEGDLPTFVCLLKLFFVIGFTGVLVYLTFFCSIFFKFYVGLSCVYLYFVTNNGIHIPELLGHRADLHEKRNS
ncbi:hypothetical protein LUZ61_002581 [Rhynchospora tenuis]|uniref:1-acylglycerol-3-phosphate O-acyltransferase n=1 Tax=Rhynchospora tenuis TaxID=198213 RepID=A0AAD6ERY7_9POAL|nr:hypothetical protein LUZ61_002581 [Rhynchospora tenuis]